MQTTSTFAMKECCIKLTQWLDNGVVTLASSVFGTNPIRQSKRWSKMLKQNVNIQTPFAVQQYNSGMGGTDRMDQNINAYRVAIRGKKWWWYIFTWVLDASLQNAWLLRQMQGNEILQKSFRREIAMTYLKSFQNKPLRTRSQTFQSSWCC